MTDSQTIRLLIVDDEQNIRRLCVTVGKGLGFDCSEAESAEAALARGDLRCVGATTLLIASPLCTKTRSVRYANSRFLSWPTRWGAPQMDCASWESVLAMPSRSTCP